MIQVLGIKVWETVVGNVIPYIVYNEKTDLIVRSVFSYVAF